MTDAIVHHDEVIPEDVVPGIGDEATLVIAQETAIVKETAIVQETDGGL